MLCYLVCGSGHFEELHQVDFHPSRLIGFQMFKLSSAACIMLRFHCNLKSLDHCRQLESVVWSISSTSQLLPTTLLCLVIVVPMLMVSAIGKDGLTLSCNKPVIPLHSVT